MTFRYYKVTLIPKLLNKKMNDIFLHLLKQNQKSTTCRADPPISIPAPRPAQCAVQVLPLSITDLSQHKTDINQVKSHLQLTKLTEIFRLLEYSIKTRQPLASSPDQTSPDLKLLKAL